MEQPEVYLTATLFTSENLSMFFGFLLFFLICVAVADMSSAIERMGDGEE